MLEGFIMGVFIGALCVVLYVYRLAIKQKEYLKQYYTNKNQYKGIK